jgi:hypothetical protein
MSNISRILLHHLKNYLIIAIGKEIGISCNQVGFLKYEVHVLYPLKENPYTTG